MFSNMNNVFSTVLSHLTHGLVNEQKGQSANERDRDFAIVSVCNLCTFTV